MLDRPLLEAFIGWLARRVVEKKGPDLRAAAAAQQPQQHAVHRVHAAGGVAPLRLGADAARYARIHRDEYPRPHGLNANFIDEYLMEQIESEENLALLDPETRAFLLICRDEGLRIGEVLTLKTDCLKKTASGRWALVHYKSKDKSYRAIPASRVVVEMIRGQVNRVRQQHGDTCRWLFPKVMGNPDGKYPMPYGTVDTRLNAWMSLIKLIDANGDPASVSWHQFRHTLGTRMANAGVSGRTIREVLGHTSCKDGKSTTPGLPTTSCATSTRRSTRSASTSRARPCAFSWRMTRLASSGWPRRSAAACTRSAAAGAAWTSPWPCPKTAADGCYVCEDFQSAPRFLPIHQDTLVRTRELQAAAEAAGRTRAAGVNARLAAGVEHLIARITAAEQDGLQLPPGEEDNGSAADALARDADHAG